MARERGTRRGGIHTKRERGCMDMAPEIDYPGGGGYQGEEVYKPYPYEQRFSEEAAGYGYTQDYTDCGESYEEPYSSTGACSGGYDRGQRAFMKGQQQRGVSQRGKGVYNYGSGGQYYDDSGDDYTQPPKKYFKSQEVEYNAGNNIPNDNSRGEMAGRGRGAASLRGGPGIGARESPRIEARGGSAMGGNAANGSRGALGMPEHGGVDRGSSSQRLRGGMAPSHTLYNQYGYDASYLEDGTTASDGGDYYSQPKMPNKYGYNESYLEDSTTAVDGGDNYSQLKMPNAPSIKGNHDYVPEGDNDQKYTQEDVPIEDNEQDIDEDVGNIEALHPRKSDKIKRKQKKLENKRLKQAPDKLKVWTNPVVLKNRESLKEDIVRYLKTLPDQKQQKRSFWGCLFQFTKTNLVPQFYGVSSFKFLFDLYLDILVKNGNYYQLRDAPRKKTDLIGKAGNKNCPPSVEAIYWDGTFSKRVVDIVTSEKGMCSWTNFKQIYHALYGCGPRHPRNWAVFPEGVSFQESTLYLKDVASSKAVIEIESKCEAGPAHAENRASLKREIISFFSSQTPQHSFPLDSFWDELFEFTGRTWMMAELGVSQRRNLFGIYTDLLKIDQDEKHVYLITDNSVADCEVDSHSGEAFLKRAVDILQNFSGSCDYKKFVDTYLDTFGRQSPNASGVVVSSLVNLKNTGVVSINDGIIQLTRSYVKANDLFLF